MRGRRQAEAAAGLRQHRGAAAPARGRLPRPDATADRPAEGGGGAGHQGREHRHADGEWLDGAGLFDRFVPPGAGELIPLARCPSKVAVCVLD